MSDNPDRQSDFLCVTLVVPDPQRRRTLAAVIAETSRTIVREFDVAPRDVIVDGSALLGRGDVRRL